MAPVSRRGFVDRLTAASVGAMLAPAVLQAKSSPNRSPLAAPVDEADWERLRKEFLPSDRIISANAANMAPAPRVVVDAIDEATRRIDADVSYQNRARYNEARERVRTGLADMAGASPDEIAIVRNASEANNIIVGGLHLAAGDEVLLFDQNHPTNNVAWDVRAARHGITVRRVALPAHPSGPDELLDLFARAATPRTRVLSFSHVSNSSGLMLPAAALTAWAHGRGMHVHVDGAQTFAATPIDLAAIGCDSYSASFQKWMMGPRESGMLFVRASRQDAVWPGVVGVGWGTDADPDPRGARRFETMGQRDDAIFAGLDAALGFHRAVGTDRIAARIRELADRIHAGLTAQGHELVTPPDPALRLGVVILKADGNRARDLHERLYRRHGVVASNTGGLRFSPTVSATRADVDRLLAAVAAEMRA